MKIDYDTKFSFTIPYYSKYGRWYINTFWYMHFLTKNNLNRCKMFIRITVNCYLKIRLKSLLIFPFLNGTATNYSADVNTSMARDDDTLWLININMTWIQYYVCLIFNCSTKLVRTCGLCFSYITCIASYIVGLTKHEFKRVKMFFFFLTSKTWKQVCLHFINDTFCQRYTRLELDSTRFCISHGFDVFNLDSESTSMRRGKIKGRWSSFRSTYYIVAGSTGNQNLRTPKCLFSNTLIMFV